MSFTPIYVPVGAPTFHLETAGDQFEKSKALLSRLDQGFVLPDEMLLTMDKLCAFLDRVHPDAIVFQNNTFANAAFITEVRRRFDCPILIWTLREPVIDGGRLRLNSLTGAYSAANAMANLGDESFSYIFGAPDEARTERAIAAFLAAGRVKKAMRSLRIAAVGHTPQGFGFGRALDTDLSRVFGAELVSIEVRELLDRAKAASEQESAAYLKKTEAATVGFDKTPERNRLDHARLYKAYSDYIRENGVGALASRCWPDLFTDFGTPVCAVLSLLGDDGVPAACESDIYGALSMWIGQQLSGAPAFFGDPVSLDEAENTLTFWHCGAAACSLARKDTGAVIGVHPNRKIGPAMDFGCEACADVTVFRVGRKPDGSFRFFILEGEALDRPKQFTGTSIVVRTDNPCLDIVNRSVKAGFEPHFTVLKGRHAAALTALAAMLGIEVCQY